ncbi:DNA polymerase Y family protein [Variovorax sp. RA8]|uniref:DNA polymerase Y family protein n=1 Tax=Variovorax sp. (strain JCM 16519 / RA8) TaxID=662548 RepID=UPI001318453A|nr:DNA polymerase Y family protein [Variovorax sp. RA8]VTU25076.1 hypothetical protein RA8CHR_03061 [Variovorax sp. RA8]
MHWIALRWPPEIASAKEVPLPSPEALGWWALQFTPRVAWVEGEALLLEVSACERLWGGRLALMREIARLNPVPDVPVQRAQGATSLVALARLRMFARGEQPPYELPSGLPLDTLSAARDHLAVLSHLGCRSWGDVEKLPRGGLTRRFGKALRAALDVAYGLAPDGHDWLQLPDSFEQKLELPALAEGAPALMWSANRLLAALQIWLRARQRGVLALELQWTLDLKRLDGVALPPHQQVTVRTAEATQDMAHLRRLLSERLALTTLAAPASWLRLRSVETAPWAGASTSFLPEDNRKGDKLHELVERLSARLGPQQVLRAVARADHRPECRQAWQPALHKPPAEAGRPKAADAIYPPWLLREPLLLDMEGERPCYQGPLRKLVGPQRVETGWWGEGQPAVRDYYIAESPKAGLVWIYRERPSSCFTSEAPRWYLQGLYA